MARMDIDLLAVALVVAEWTGTAPSPETLSPVAYAESEAERLVRQVTEACDVALPPRHPRHGGTLPVYWWNGEIAAARVECVHRRRTFTRGRGRGGILIGPKGAEAQHLLGDGEVLDGAGPQRGRRPVGETLRFIYHCSMFGVCWLNEKNIIQFLYIINK